MRTGRGFGERGPAEVETCCGDAADAAGLSDHLLRREIGMHGVKSNGEKVDGGEFGLKRRRLPFKYGDGMDTDWFSDESFSSVAKTKP